MAPDSHYAQRLGGVRSVAAGEGTVTVTLSTPNGALPVLLDIPIALGDGDRPLGTGPYVLTEEATGETVLTARSGWWQGRSLPFQTIHLASVGQADDLISSFDAGDITLLDADLTGTNSLGYSGSYEAWDYSTTNLIYLGFNTQRGPSAPPSCGVPCPGASTGGPLRRSPLPTTPSPQRYPSTLTARCTTNCCQTPRTTPPTIW